MSDSKSYTAPMPPKLSQDRRTTSTVGHQVADTKRRGNAPSIKTGMVDQRNKAVDDGMTLQPDPHDSPSMPPDRNGFAPLNGDLPEKDDAQTAQTHADPVARESEPAEVIPTSAEPPSGGETKPTVEGVENSPTGSVAQARYPAMLEEAHPVGYSGKTVR